MKTLTERTAAAIAWIDWQLAKCNNATPPPWFTKPDEKMHPAVRFSQSHCDADFIALARTGYPAALEGMKLAIEGIGFMQIHIETAPDFGKLLDSILAKIEALK